MTNQLEIAYPDEEKVVKANRLVQAKMPLSKTEHRVVAALIAQLDRDQNNFDTQSVSLKWIKEQAGISSNHIYRKAQDLCHNLVEKSIGVQEGEEVGSRTYTAYPLFDMCQYDENDGVIRARFKSEMKPLLLRLRKRFTMYRLQYFLRLSSRYSMRIYELLKMREGLSVCNLSVEKLREVLGAENSYKSFSQFRLRVVEESRKRLDEKTDLSFVYEVLRDGQTPVEVKFYIRSEPPSDPEEQIRVDLTTGTESEIGFQPITEFKKDLSQKELREAEDADIQRLYKRAHRMAVEQNPGRDSGGMVVKERTLAFMKEAWGD